MKYMAYQKKRLLALITALLLLCSLCGFRTVSFQDWAVSPTGSAKYLDGSTILISLFIEDPVSSWSEEDKNLVMSKMDLANDFLVSEGLSYDKTVNLIYDIQEHPDLSYTISYSRNIDDSDDCSYALLDYVTHYIHKNIPTQELLSSYGVDSIGYMCYLNKSGVSYTFPYYEGDSDIYYYETCFMFLTCDGDYEPPSVYAHEMLHLFGARDLYTTNAADGITRDFVQHIEHDYPNEIMLTTYDENWNNVQDYVSNDLTDITAYFIGWLDTIPEVEEYPDISCPYPACFCDTGADSGDYSDYTANGFVSETDDPVSSENSHWESEDTTASDSGNTQTQTYHSLFWRFLRMILRRLLS